MKGVSCRTAFDTQTGEAWQEVRCANRDWKEYLDEVEGCCLQLLKYVKEATSPYMNWLEVVPKVCPKGGYREFESVLLILRVAGYVMCESLLPMGIEVNATDRMREDIEGEPEEVSPDGECKKKFEELSRLREIRLTAINVFTKLEGEEVKKFITAYFSCRKEDDFLALLQTYLEEDNPLLQQLRAEALKKREEELSEEQRRIYWMDAAADVNVLAGPGSGKTHILALRCARLIYRVGALPEQLLVLAYNRAVVVELRNRLNKLFRELGMSALASRLHVYTFHQLAKKVCGGRLEGLAMSGWEGELLRVLRDDPNRFRLQIGDGVRYILIDEFQDITQTRLDVIFELKKVYTDISFFTIGDRNQSIYGFDRRPGPVSPGHYYGVLRRELPNLVEPQMRINFRSYQPILDAASFYLADEGDLPRAHQATPDGLECVEIIDSRGKSARQWWNEVREFVGQVQGKGVRDIAIFFRTNAEVFRGYGRVKELGLEGVRIRIQGTQSGELYRTREIFAVVWYLERRGADIIRLGEKETEKETRQEVERLMSVHPNWDRFYLDLAYTLVLDYLEFISLEEGEFTYADLAEYIKDTAEKDDGQLYKIYEKYQGQRIEQGQQLNIVLTTMHKVKGLEFDAVMITPSFASLPLGNGGTEAEKAEDIEEERRLMYVAYTRAKKVLRVYKWNREYALDERKEYPCPEGIMAKLGVAEKEQELDKYNLGCNASYNYKNAAWIMSNVQKNEPAEVKCEKRAGYLFYDIYVNNICVGQLSKSSLIRRKMDEEHYDQLTGFFVSEVLAWTYEDSRRYDKKNGTNYTGNWCGQAKESGFIPIVMIAGYGREQKK